MKRCAVMILVGLILLVGISSAQHDIFKKNGPKSDINVTSDLASVSYTNTVNGVSFYHTVFIDGSLMTINYNSQSSTREIWGSGNGLGNSDILIQHDFNGTANDTLKGTITIKTPHSITFPYTVSGNTNVIPYLGGFVIKHGNALDTIAIPSPTATNKTGGAVPVWYTYDSTKITLNINDSGQEYPITIDPTYLSSYDPQLVLLMHMNQTPSTPTVFIESSSGKTVTTVGGATTVSTVKKFGNASGFLDDAGDYLTLVDSSDWDLGENWTIMAWTNLTAYPSSGAVGTIVGQTDSDTDTWYVRLINTAGIYKWQIRRYRASPAIDVTISSDAVTPSLNTWNQIVFTKNLTGYTIYQNGVVVGSTIGTTTFNSISSKLTIGAYIGSSPSYYTGYIDELAIWKGVVIPISDLYPQVDEIGYYNASAVPVASFTCTPTSAMIGTPITCTDTSSDTPTNWTYYWGDGNRTDGTQNPSYTYPFIGTFSINQTVNNTMGASWYNRSNYITITNATGFTPQDIWMEQQLLQTWHITDSSTGLPIPVVQLQDSAMQTFATTNGTGYLTEEFGASTVVFISEGYNSKAVSYFFDSEATHTVQLVTAGTNEPVYNVYPPKDVKFHITSFFGAPIPGASVTIQGITTSTGNWDWLVTLLGISLDEVAINGTAMTESTDTNGDVVFLMLPSVKYNITTTATGYTFPTTFIAPQAIEYTITANWNESWFSSGNDTLNDVNVSVSWVKKNDTHSFVNISYDDQTRTTTGGTIQVYLDSAGRVANATSVATMDITSTTCSNSTLVNTPTGGASYRVLVNATTTDSNIVRTFTHYFKGAPVTLPGFDSESILWLALFIVIFTAAFAGAIHSPQMSIVLCVESWVFWAIGWLDALITQFWYGETAIIGILTLASFIALLWNITEGKSKVKRSS